MIHEDRLLKYEFLWLILELDLYYGFEGQFLEKFRSSDVIALVELLFLPWGTHLDIYELRILVNKHVEKRIGFSPSGVVLGIRGKFCTVSTLMVLFWNNAHCHLSLG